MARATISIPIAAAAVGAVILVSNMGSLAQAPAPVVKTAWGEPDLQGIWTDETDTPLQRSPKFANQEFFTPAQRAELDQQRGALLGRDQRAERGTVADLAGAYNDVFTPKKRTGLRTSRIVDPPNGRLPPLTPEAQKIAAAERAFRLALLQATETCKNHESPCAGGKYDPTPSPHYADLPPRYNTGGMNRYYGPEDASLAVRCLMGGVPENGTLGAIADRISFRRIVQTPGGISMFYDVGQGQGWQRNIVMNGSPHLPSNIRQWFGDSRGHWEGNTLVIDVTNFSAKTDFQGSRENLHVVERWTRTGPATLDYSVTVDDPTVWMRPWTAKQEFTLQSNEENRIYTEPRCIEGNYGLPGLLLGHRVEEQNFAKGKGADPRTISTVSANDSIPDPLQ
ncbi:MAG: hypothetical protein KGO48_10690 [Alphaproteobacteria bacterium]|nr:hypothetical protein [Alphaproteobacteria bacterium]